MKPDKAPAPLSTSLRRTLIRLLILAVVVVAVNYLVGWVMDLSDQVNAKHMMFGVITLMILIYIVLMATPFVPGIEIGLSLMFMRGDDVVIVVYLATVTGLMLAFLAGRYISYRLLHRIFMDLRLTKACDLLEALEPLDKQQRLDRLRERLPKVLRPFLVDLRYVLVGTLVNVPGNALIGGGGGILMVAGLSHVFSVPAMLLTLLIAVSPVPVLVLVFDIEIASYF